MQDTKTSPAPDIASVYGKESHPLCFCGWVGGSVCVRVTVGQTWNAKGNWRKLSLGPTLSHLRTYCMYGCMALTLCIWCKTWSVQQDSAQQLKCNFANNDMLLTLFALGCIISNGGAQSKIWEESHIYFLPVQHGKMVLLKKKEAEGIICSFIACPRNSHSDLFLKDCLAALPGWIYHVLNKNTQVWHYSLLTSLEAGERKHDCMRYAV